ncbi:DNA primase family protein [Microbacterium sp. A84]|uniref:DNA primase family protein n=1 Tax=Microbacterium sp. A84 TaxID=3450715 RepID=UPI003F443562
MTDLVLDQAAWNVQYNALYAPHLAALSVATGGDAARLTLSVIGTNKQHRALAPVRIDDPDAAWKAVQRDARANASCYLGIAAAVPSHLTGRINKDVVLALPALVADLDTADGEHKGQLAKGLALPTMDEALGWVRELPVPATLVTTTGGGLHVWMRAEELIVPGTTDGDAALVAWKAFWVGLADRDGRHIDSGVLSDVARIMRMAGTGSHKPDVAAGFTVQIAQHNQDSVLTRAHLEAMMPEPVAVAVASKVAPQRKAVAAGSKAVVASTAPGTRPGDVFNRECDAEALGYWSIELLGAIEPAPNLLILPVPTEDGEFEYGDTPNASIAAGDSGEVLLKVFGERVKAAYGIEGHDRLTAFDVICLAVKEKGAGNPAAVVAGMLKDVRVVVDGVAQYDNLLEAVESYDPAAAVVTGTGSQVIEGAVRDTSYIDELVQAFGLELGFTDLGGAKLMHRHIVENGSGVRHAPELGYLFYTGAVWQRDNGSIGRGFAHDLAELVADKAVRARWAVGDDPGKDASPEAQKAYAQRAAAAKALADFGRRLSSTRGIDSVLTELRALKGVPARSREFDTQRHLLAVENGVVDLKTGELLPHSPDHMITRQVHHSYDPNAPIVEPERFLQFLAEIFPAKPAEMTAFMQRMLGYGVTGETSEHAFAIFVGKGRNGKSVLLETIAAIFEELHQTAPFSTFEDSKGGIPNDVAMLDGARLVSASEGDFGRPMSESTLKRASGGDAMPARFLRQEFFTFMPKFLLMLATNHEPQLRGQDDGLWERIMLIRFEKYFTKEKRDKGLMAKLMAEAEQIVSWVIRGAMTWYKNGLQTPAFVDDATKAYRKSSDQIEGFLPGIYEATPAVKDELEVVPLVLASEMFSDFRSWAFQGNHQSMLKWSIRAFYKALLERGFERVEGAGRTAFIRGVVRVAPLDD